MPACPAASGSRLASVIPGIVLISSTNGAPLLGQNQIHTRIDFEAQRTVRGERGLLHKLRLRLIERRGAEMVRPDSRRVRIEKRILVFEIVKALLRQNLDHRQREVAEDADGQFTARDELLDQQRVVELRGRARARARSDPSFSQWRRRRARPLARRLDHKRQRQRVGCSARLDNFKFRLSARCCSMSFFLVAILSNAVRLPSTPSPV